MSRATAPRFSGIGGHHSHKAGTVEWLTPPRIITALGQFGRDPCAPIIQPYPTALKTYTILDDGLAQTWSKEERIWLNPPYADGVIELWLAKLAEHGRGTALIFARTETAAFHRYVWEQAHALLFMKGRINFHIGEGFSNVKTRRTYYAGDEADGNAGAPTVLCAYGVDDADVLAACEIEGQFVPLRIPRSVVVSMFATAQEGEKSDTWAAEVLAWWGDRPGPILLEDLYRAFATHPKARTNRNVEAKLRQQLQRGPYRRVGRGLWERTDDDALRA